MRQSTLKQDFFNIPNMITLVRILAIPLMLVFLYRPEQQFHLWSPLLFTFIGITDFLDGFLARRWGLTSIMGKFMDPLADKLLVNSVLIALVEMGRVNVFIVIALIGRETIVTGLRSLASSEGIVMGASWWGKWKTAAQLFALMLLMVHGTYYWDFFFWKPLVNFNQIGNYMLYLALALSLWGCIDYFKDFLKGAFSKENAKKATTESAK